MKKTTSVILGICLIILGLIFGLNALDITNIDIFFDGWWTLFIIIPSFIDLFKEKADKTGNIIGLALGVFLLLCAQGILEFSLVFKLFVPIVIIIIGFKIIFQAFCGSKVKEVININKANGYTEREYAAVFSGNDVIINGEVFEGAKLTAVFGGVELNLIPAIINKDCVINVNATFGGIDIILPENVNVVSNVTGIFGGVSNKRKNNPANSVTVYVTGLCMFGGTDIK